MKPGYYVVVAVTDADEGLAETRAILAPTGIKGYVTYVPTYQGCTH
jgi:hypothetical protein